MTKPDEIEDTGVARPFLGQVLFYLGICLATGAAGAGYLNFMERGVDLRGAGIVATIMVLGVAAMLVSLRIGNFDKPSLSTKTGRSQLILLVCVLAGALTGFVLVTNGLLDRVMAGDFTLTRSEAWILLIVVLGIGVPLGALRERQIDDFERQSTRDAAYWAFSVYLYVYICWAIAAAGSLLPPVHDGALFLAVMFAFLVIWAAKRAG
ncbi:hypothetical protein CD351_09780 [Erythrobacter sp. KY5]|uniref:hypothetical protein n=1 Tax=Erythrobacter sp. KY5 TaxID=2011159 RepID=UPI000DBF319D|nr:hypothetical protein [Erythrobacter sp. KY5]AWW74711.1 hypothetical protein CD351_09780 [Erythrobacter sp. KY5]